MYHGRVACACGWISTCLLNSRVDSGFCSLWSAQTQRSASSKHNAAVWTICGPSCFNWRLHFTLLHYSHLLLIDAAAFFLEQIGFFLTKRGCFFFFSPHEKVFALFSRKRSELWRKRLPIIYPSGCQAFFGGAVNAAVFPCLGSLQTAVKPPLPDDALSKYSRFNDTLCGFTLENLSPDSLSLHYSSGRRKPNPNLNADVVVVSRGVWQRSLHNTLVRGTERHQRRLQASLLNSLHLFNTIGREREKNNNKMSLFF